MRSASRNLHLNQESYKISPSEEAIPDSLSTPEKLSPQEINNSKPNAESVSHTEQNVNNVQKTRRSEVETIKQTHVSTPTNSKRALPSKQKETSKGRDASITYEKQSIQPHRISNKGLSRGTARVITSKSGTTNASTKVVKQPNSKGLKVLPETCPSSACEELKGKLRWRQIVETKIINKNKQALNQIHIAAEKWKKITQALKKLESKKENSIKFDDKISSPQEKKIKKVNEHSGRSMQLKTMSTTHTAAKSVVGRDMDKKKQQLLTREKQTGKTIQKPQSTNRGVKPKETKPPITVQRKKITYPSQRQSAAPSVHKKTTVPGTTHKIPEKREADKHLIAVQEDSRASTSITIVDKEKAEFVNQKDDNLQRCSEDFKEKTTSEDAESITHQKKLGDIHLDSVEFMVESIKVEKNESKEAIVDDMHAIYTPEPLEFQENPEICTASVELVPQNVDPKLNETVVDHFVLDNSLEKSEEKEVFESTTDDRESITSVEKQIPEIEQNGKDNDHQHDSKEQENQVLLEEVKSQSGELFENGDITPQQENIDTAVVPQQETIDTTVLPQETIDAAVMSQQEYIATTETPQQENIVTAVIAQQENVDTAEISQQETIDTAVISQEVDVDTAVTLQQENIDTAVSQETDTTVTLQQEIIDTAIISEQVNVDTAITLQQENLDTAEITSQQETVDTVVTSQQVNVDTATVSQQENLDTEVTSQQETVETAVISQQETVDTAVTSQYEIVDTAITSQQETIDTAVTSQQETVDTAVISQQETVDTAVTSQHEIDDTAVTAQEETVDIDVTSQQENVDIAVTSKQGNLDTTVTSNIDIATKEISENEETNQDIANQKDKFVISHDDTIENGEYETTQMSSEHNLEEIAETTEVKQKQNKEETLHFVGEEQIIPTSASSETENIDGVTEDITLLPQEKIEDEIKISEQECNEMNEFSTSEIESDFADEKVDVLREKSEAEQYTDEKPNKDWVVEPEEIVNPLLEEMPMETVTTKQIQSRIYWDKIAESVKSGEYKIKKSASDVDTDIKSEETSETMQQMENDFDKTTTQGVVLKTEMNSENMEQEKLEDHETSMPKNRFRQYWIKIAESIRKKVERRNSKTSGIKRWNKLARLVSFLSISFVRRSRALKVAPAP